MVFEEDYRFWPAGEDPQQCDDYAERLQDLLAQEEALNNSGAYRPEEHDDSAAAGAKGEAAKGRQKGIRVAGKYHHTPQRHSTDDQDDDDGLNQEVADLIRMATFAHRQKCGELIWFGWECQGSGKQPSWLWKASHGIMLTQRGAGHIADGMHTNKILRDHIDLALAWWLRRPYVAERTKACYLYPPIGSYGAHISGCDPENFGEAAGGRPAGWDGKLNPARGTRVETDSKYRSKWLIQWQGTGKDHKGRTWIAFPQDHVLHSQQYKWRTFREEPTASLPPPPPAPPAGRGSAGQAPSSAAGTVCKAEMTQRQQRIARGWRMRETFRVVTHNIDEAAPSIASMYCLRSRSQHRPFHFPALESAVLLVSTPSFPPQQYGSQLQTMGERHVLEFHVQSS